MARNHTRINGSYRFLCENCPLNALEPYEAATGAAEVALAERPTDASEPDKHDLSQFASACLLAHQQRSCEDPNTVTRVVDDVTYPGDFIVSREDYDDARLPITMQPPAPQDNWRIALQREIAFIDQPR